MDNLEQIVRAALGDFDASADSPQLENAKAKYLGKSGVLTDLLKGLGKLPSIERPAAGARINEAKEVLLGER